MSHTPFFGSIPDDRLYCPRCGMCFQEAGEGEVLIGAPSFGILLAGEIIAFASKPRCATVALGRGMGRWNGARRYCRFTRRSRSPSSTATARRKHALTEKPAILVCSARPEDPELCVTPLVPALAARALDAEVEIHFAGPAVRWLVY
jgi:hypothetical protein